MGVEQVKVVVFGASGVVGRAAAVELGRVPGCTVVGVSRRSPRLPEVVHAPIDLTDPGAAEQLRSDPFRDVTHVVFAALQEADDLVAGWRDRELMARNLSLFEHAVRPLVEAPGSGLRHVSLLQGGKAYGLHLGKTPVPAKERAPRDPHENFYFLQEDLLGSLAEEHGFGWTIFRPQVVYGESFASPMNIVPVIGVYAALLRAEGLPLHFPGGGRQVRQAVDARLVGRALAWAATAPAARGETFNITNGDVFDWHEVWPTIADALGMEVGPPQPMLLAETMPGRGEAWAAIVDRHDLLAPRDLDAFVGPAWAYADIIFGSHAQGPALPSLLSTIKLRQAGFGDCIDTEDMFRELLTLFQERRLLPRPA